MTYALNATKRRRSIKRREMKRIGIVAVLIGIPFVLLWMGPAYTHRVRLTIEVQTPDGIKSGSSVIEKD